MADTAYTEPRRKPSKEALEEVHDRAMRRADEAWSFERENIADGKDDQKFYIGGKNQWPEGVHKQRTESQRPMLTVNRMASVVRQLTGEIRRETPAIKVMPAKNGANETLAEIFNGLIRNIEVQSDADACYAIAAENAAIAGQGAFRLNTVYSGDDGFEQDVRFFPIRDPFGFLIDPMATLPDKSDMQWAFVFSRMSREAYKDEYPDESETDFPTNSEAGFTWATGDTIKIAEYWERKHDGKKTLYLYGPAPGIVTETPIQGMQPVRTREVESYKICSYKLSGSTVLSGPHYFAGRFIPICVMTGEEVSIDGATVRKGMIRDAKDPQRLLNYARTTEAESTALQPKAPFIMTVSQHRGYDEMWNRAGSDNLPYLLYNPDPLAPGAPQRSQPPVMSQGLNALSLAASQDIRDVTGIHEASLGQRSNETSGRAILARQREGDTGTFLYNDNLRRCIAYAGRVLVDLIPRVYDSERIVRVLEENGDHEMVEINKPQVDARGQIELVNDLSVGEYDVVVTTGPSYQTQREEKREALIGLTQAMPALGEVAPDLVVDSLDFPGGKEIVKRMRRKMGLDEKGEPIEQAPPPPDPALVAKAMAEAAKADKTKAEAEGIEIDNASKLLELQQMMTMTQQGLNQLGQMLGAVLALNDPQRAMGQMGQQGQPMGQPPVPSGVPGPPQGLGGPMDDMVPVDGLPPGLGNPQVNGAGGMPGDDMVPLDPGQRPGGPF